MMYKTRMTSSNRTLRDIGEDVMLFITKEWITLADIALLDISLCNRSQRPWFLHILQSKFLVLRAQRWHDSVLCWIYLRHITIQNLSIQTVQKNRSFWHKGLIPINTDHINDLSLSIPPRVRNAHIQFVNLINSCPNVKSIRFGRCYEINTILTHGGLDDKIIQQLTHFDLGNSLVSSYGMEYLAKICRNLVSFIARCDCSSDVISTLIYNNINLTRIIIKNQEQLNAEFFHKTLDNRNLVTFKANCYSDIHLSDVAELVQSNKRTLKLVELQSTEFSLKYFKSRQQECGIHILIKRNYTLPLFLETFFRRVTNFTEISLKNIHVTMDDFHSIATQNPKLETLILDCCEIKYNEGIMLFLLQKCPHLIRLHLGGCKDLTDINLQSLFTNNSESKIACLLFSDNFNLTTETVIAIIKANPQLTDFIVNNCPNVAHSEVETFLFEHRKENSAITTYDLTYNWR